MKKIILIMALVMAFSFANAQSNDKGKIHVNVMFGIINGNASITNDYGVIFPTFDPNANEIDYSAAGVNFGANFQYGFTKNISAGAGIEINTVELTNNNVDDTSLTLFKVNFSGRYYFLNHEKINVYAGPSIGYTSGIVSSGENFLDDTYSGLNYGINTGCNYYFGEKVGMIFNLGYEVNSLGNVSIDGVKAMLGLALKFR
jgi:hypothetical protein